MLSLSDIRKMQADGWRFADGGLRIAHCWVVWANRGEEWAPQFIADPDEHPELWIEPTATAAGPAQQTFDI